jgi:hypothetical protein
MSAEVPDMSAKVPDMSAEVPDMSAKVPDMSAKLHAWQGVCAIRRSPSPEGVSSPAGLRMEFATQTPRLDIRQLSLPRTFPPPKGSQTATRFENGVLLRKTPCLYPAFYPPPKGDTTARSHHAAPVTPPRQVAAGGVARITECLVKNKQSRYYVLS